MATGLKSAQALLMMLGLLGCGISVAATFTDPTRPAIDLVPNLVSGDGRTGDAGDSGEAGMGRLSEKSGKGLQSVILSPNHESAIINGVEVVLGEKYGDAVLTVVSETCVVLMGPEGRQVLHMFPSVKMTKNEMACIKRTGLQPIQKPAGVKVAKRERVAPRKHKARAKQGAVVCVPEVNKDGGVK
ncbi:MAG: hypothetical protein PHP57_03695 [Sideroxydans sp.]|nr:hypothetical protein [Sideroxydans sp.]